MISLKWLIQTWHALILALVLAALGVGFYFNEKSHRLTELDFTLDQQIHPLVHAAEVLRGRASPPGERHERRPPPGERHERGRPPGDREGREFPPGERHRNDSAPGERPFPKRRSPANLPPPSGGWKIDRNAFGPGHLPRPPDGGVHGKRTPFDGVERRFKDLGFYCLIWDPITGELIYRSNHSPEMEAPMDLDNGYMKRIRDGRYREIFHANPAVRIVVAFDLTQAYAELDHLKWQIAGVMFAIYAISLLIGGWLVSRSLSPLKVIQRAAGAFAKGKLKERIPQKNGDKVTELSHLTKDLNHTFGELDDLFQRQVRFTADASHELRTPLTSLIGHLKLGRSKPRSIEEHAEILETCERSARRIQRITDDLLELSRYDSGRFELECEPLSLDQLLKCLADDLQPVFAEQGSSLRTDLQPVGVSCDPFRLEQVIANLINNALEHNPAPVTITLRLRSEPGSVCIDVIDNGRGIQPENLDKLFDRFFQESGSRTKSLRNMNVGLGLSISKAIVDAHGGTITATSKPQIETIFTIHLPSNPAGSSSGKN